MILYNEEDFLQLSGIQHFVFCRRQWALAYIELQWDENVRTIEGHLLHEKAHDSSIAETRGDMFISRAMPIHSRELGISGECDVVEFHRTMDSSEGIFIQGHEGMYYVVPIEYKRGSPKKNDSDVLQLAAQVMCLEEMFCCRIQEGYLYYGETRHRTKVVFSEELRQKVKDIFLEMHKYYEQRYTPKVKRSKSCNACSLQERCMPVLNGKKSAGSYINQTLSAAAEKGEEKCDGCETHCI